MSLLDQIFPPDQCDDDADQLLEDELGEPEGDSSLTGAVRAGRLDRLASERLLDGET